MKTFLDDATLLEPTELAPDVQESFRAAIAAASAEDLRVSSDEEGRTTVRFRFEADNDREAMRKGSEITLSALADHASIRWVAADITHWQDG